MTTGATLDAVRRDPIAASILAELDRAGRAGEPPERLDLMALADRLEELGLGGGAAALRRAAEEGKAPRHSWSNAQTRNRTKQYGLIKPSWDWWRRGPETPSPVQNEQTLEDDLFGRLPSECDGDKLWKDGWCEYATPAEAWLGLAEAGQRLAEKDQNDRSST